MAVEEVPKILLFAGLDDFVGSPESLLESIASTMEWARSKGIDVLSSTDVEYCDMFKAEPTIVLSHSLRERFIHLRESILSFDAYGPWDGPFEYSVNKLLDLDDKTRPKKIQIVVGGSTFGYAGILEGNTVLTAQHSQNLIKASECVPLACLKAATQLYSELQNPYTAVQIVVAKNITRFCGLQNEPSFRAGAPSLEFLGILGNYPLFREYDQEVIPMSQVDAESS